MAGLTQYRHNDNMVTNQVHKIYPVEWWTVDSLSGLVFAPPFLSVGSLMFRGLYDISARYHYRVPIPQIAQSSE